MARLFEKATTLTTLDDTLRFAIGKSGQAYDNITYADFKALFYEDFKTDIANIQYRKYLFNFVDVYFSGASIRPGVTTFTLPVGYRPSKNIKLALAGDDDLSTSTVAAYADITTGGVITFKSTGDTDIVGGIYITFPLD